MRAITYLQLLFLDHIKDGIKIKHIDKKTKL